MVHVVQSGGTAMVVTSTALSSLTTSCTSAKICKATLGVTSASVRQVDLATGTTASIGSATMTVNTVEPNKYAVSIAGAVIRSLGSAASPLVIDFGSIEVG